MPHINLLYPFIEDPPIEKLKQAATTLVPFKLTMSDLHAFEQGPTVTIHLSPDDKNPVKKVQSTLEKLFPMCNHLSNKSPTGFQPHLTIGQCPVKAKDKMLRKWKSEIKPLTWLVDEFVFIRRNGEGAFKVVERFKMTKSLIPKQIVSSTQTPKPGVIKPGGKPPQSKIKGKETTEPEKTETEQEDTNNFEIPKDVKNIDYKFDPQNHIKQSAKRVRLWMRNGNRTCPLPKNKEK